MAGSVNKVILIGNLGADPEVRRTQDGRPIVNLRVATSDSWKDKTTGERKEKTEWHRVVIFNENLCRIAEQYLKKGSKVFIEGALQTRKWQDQSGQDRYSTEVVLQGFRGELTLLDRRPAAPARGGGGGDFGADEAGGEFGSPGPTRKVAAAAARGGGRARRHGRRNSVLSYRRVIASESEAIQNGDIAWIASSRCYFALTLNRDVRPHFQHQVRARARRRGDVRQLALPGRLHAARASLAQRLGRCRDFAVRRQYRNDGGGAGRRAGADQRLAAGLGDRPFAVRRIVDRHLARALSRHRGVLAGGVLSKRASAA